MTRPAILLLIRVRAGKFRLTLPILLPVLVYALTLAEDLGIYAFGRKSTKLYQLTHAAQGVRLLLKELAAYGKLDFVDVDAWDENEGRAVVKLSLW